MSKTVQTEWGDVEVDVVECDSCGATVMRENAMRFVMMDPERIKTDRARHSTHRWEVSNRGYRAGWACEHCHDAGPVEFPRVRSASECFAAFYDAVFIDDFGVHRMSVFLFVVASLALWFAHLVALLSG